MSKLVRTILVPAFAVGFAPLVWAQHGHGQHEEHGKPVEFKMPTTYAGAVAEIEHRLHEISELIESKQLAKVHAEADVIQKVAKVIGQLALKEGSGVPKEAVKDVNVAGKDLAAKFDAIDKAGDSGDLAGTKKVYAEMVALTATLSKHTGPGTYRAAIADINHRLAEISGLIEAKKLGGIAAEADGIQKTAKMLGALASKDGSDVPKEAAKNVSAAADSLAAKAGGMSKIGAGDVASAKKVYDEMSALMAGLQKYVVAPYQCPMKCEGEKTYAQAGKCPKCGMDLKPVKKLPEHADEHRP